jgi:hypothetical protein
MRTPARHDPEFLMNKPEEGFTIFADAHMLPASPLTLSNTPGTKDRRLHQVDALTHRKHRLRSTPAGIGAKSPCVSQDQICGGLIPVFSCHSFG